MSSIRDLYEAALALPPAEREPWLVRHCADEGLRRRVLAMVEATAASAPLARPLDELADALGGNDEAAVALPSGGRIGAFELAGVLGQGGFSTVYRGVRDVEGVAHEVAIKLLHRGLHTAAAQRQFRREQRALAQLRHPNIARLIEGGVTDAGLPYIALELVEGERITEHACRLRLGLRARLELFLVVCGAVEAAHRALIVHRDLKPANVLVTGEGHVKLLDFGIAKLLDEVDTDDATRTGHQPFTPAYAAPEQRAGTQVTTATDVYALGVLLGELVSGQRLNDGKGTTPASYISGDEPAGVLPEPAALMRRRLRGDLGAIMQKALADEPERRYASAAGLADDVRRLLEERPVSAQKPTRWYRARRFVQRHRSGVAMTVAFMLALLAAFAAVVWQAEEARRHAQRADVQAARAVAVRDFLVSLFEAAQARMPEQQKPTVDQLVDQARRRLAEERAQEPGLRADVLTSLAMVSTTYGDLSGALAMLDEAVALKAALYDEDDPERWSIDVQRANVLDRMGRRVEAATMLEPRLPAMHRHQGKAAVEGLQVLAALHAAEGRAESAVALAQEAVRKGLPLLAPDSPEALKLAAFPGLTLGALGREREQSEWLLPIIERWRTLGLPRNSDFAEMLNNVGIRQVQIGNTAAGESLLAEVVEIERGIAPMAPSLAISLRNLATIRLRLGRSAEAEASLFESLEIVRAAFAPESIGRVAALVSLSDLRRQQGRWEEAEVLLQETVLPCSGSDGARDDACARAHLSLAAISQRTGRLAQAREHVERARDLREPRGGPNLALVLARLAHIQNVQGNPKQALASVNQSLAILRGQAMEHGPESALARIAGAQAHLSRTEAGAALDLLDPLRARWEAEDAAAIPTRFHFLAVRALALEASGDRKEARRVAGLAVSMGLEPVAIEDDLRRAVERLAAE